MKLLSQLGIILLFFICVPFLHPAQNKDAALNFKTVDKILPDDECSVLNETVRVRFLSRTDKKGKNPSFVIEEQHNSQYFTTEETFQKIFSVFYDDFSAVTSINCKAGGSTIANLPVVRSNYESNSVFHDDIKVCLFPVELKKDKLYDVGYTKETYNPRLFSKMYFTGANSVYKKSITFEVPLWLDLELKEINFEGYKITRREQTPAGKKYKEIVFEATRLEREGGEHNAPSHAKYLPHLLVFIKSYALPGKQKEVLFRDQASVYEWCKNLIDSADATEWKELDAVAKQIKGNETDSVKIMEKVFYWVQDHVRYIAFEDGIMGYKPMSAQKVYTQLYGDCKGMANLTKSLMKKLGFDARITWIGTTDIPYKNDLPILAVYNHMICCVFLKGKKYFLDGTENWIALDDYAERIQGRPVMIEDGKSYINAMVPEFGYDRNRSTCFTEFNVAGNKLAGKCEYVLNGEGKTNFLRRISSTKSENKMQSVKNYLKNDNSNIEVIKFGMPDLNDRSLPIKLNCELDLKNSSYALSNNEMLLLPEKDFDFENFEFDSLRRTDYEFRRKYYLVYETKINLPPNTKVKSVPEPINVDNANYSFVLKYDIQNNAVTEVKSIIIKNPLLPKKIFSQWNKDILLLKKFYHQPVVLVKK